MKEKIIELLNTRFSDAIESVNEYRGELTFVVKKSRIREICFFLRDNSDLRFDTLRDICGADYYRPEERYEVIYNIYSLTHNFRLRLKVRINESDLHLDSVVPVWSTADWEERETYDMFGIIFEGHPDLRRMYMPEEFEFYPLRKDFPLMGIPGSLTLPRK